MIPNPYLWKDYKLLVIIPVLLIIISLVFFVPRIPQGIDLKGGLLITVQTSSNVDAQVLKDKLSRFSASVDVRSFDNPAGRGVEIELANDQNLIDAETALAKLHIAYSNYVQAQLNRTAFNTSAGIAASYSAEVFKQATIVLQKTSSGQQLPKTEAEAVKAAEDEFGNAQQNQRDQLIEAVKEATPVQSYSFKEVGSSLSAFFLSKTREVVLYSFLLSAIVIFIVFRSFVPSFAVIFGAFADISITAGVMGLLQIELSLASIAALLMLIGFSLDTDVLLTMRILKRNEGTPYDRAFDAMKTAFMMNITTIAAFGVLAILAAMLQIQTYYAIGVIAVIGGTVDFIATWCANAVMVLWHTEREAAKKRF